MCVCAVAAVRACLRACVCAGGGAGNTETYHLWKAWEEASGKPIADIMRGWTEQMGFPLLEVERAGGRLAVKQSWFLADGSAPDGRSWTVPLFAASRAGPALPESAALLAAPEADLELGASVGAGDWVKVNGGQHVPCRVAYDAASFDLLCAAAAAQELGPADRAGLLNDALALCKAGHASMPPGRLLQLAAAFRAEEHATVWAALAAVLKSVNAMLAAACAGGGERAAADKAAFAAFAGGLVGPAITRVGWASRPDDGHLGKMKRQTLVELTALFCRGDAAVAAKARELFDAFMGGDKDALVTATFATSLRFSELFLIDK